jgi:hypothetical protein
MIRYRSVPEPREELLRDVYAAVPADPAATDDCCARIREATELPDRESAREWLVFVRALGLAGRTDQGFYRLEWTEEPQALGEAFENGVLGAQEVIEAIAESGPVTREQLVDILTADDAFSVDRQGAGSGPDLETRVDRLLEWSVLFERVAETDGRYDSTPDQ